LGRDHFPVEFNSRRDERKRIEFPTKTVHPILSIAEISVPEEFRNRGSSNRS
jgi:hypothetical protein